MSNPSPLLISHGPLLFLWYWLQHQGLRAHLRVPRLNCIDLLSLTELSVRTDKERWGDLAGGRVQGGATPPTVRMVAPK